jgi:hypothetical protein
VITPYGRKKNPQNDRYETDEIAEMATVRPKSPRPVGPKSDKEESIWDKLGTLGRKKRIKEGNYTVKNDIQ